MQLAEAAFKEQIAQVVCLRLLEGESGTACRLIALFRLGVLRFVGLDSHSSYRMHVFLLACCASDPICAVLHHVLSMYRENIREPVMP